MSINRAEQGWPYEQVVGICFYSPITKQWQDVKDADAVSILGRIVTRINEARREFRAIPEGKRRLGIPVGRWAHKRSRLNCELARLESLKLHVDWFARRVQPTYMDWSRDVLTRLPESLKR